MALGCWQLVKRLNYFVVWYSVCALVLVSCGEAVTSKILNNPASRYLYVASGACFGGGVALATGSGTIAKINLENGATTLLKDYRTPSSSDQPAGLASYNSAQLLTIIENTAGRRIEFVSKFGSGSSPFFTNAVALASVTRSLSLLSDGGMLVADTVSVEKFSSSGGRVSAPFISAPAAPCATSTTQVMNTAETSVGKLLMVHAAATPNNKTNLISATGYVVAGDCLASITGFATTALPTAALHHSSGKLLIAYGSTTLTSNAIYAYDINLTANTITNPVAAFTNTAVVNGPTAMIEDTATGKVYVAMGTSSFNTIEQFTFNSTTKLLSRDTTTPFAPNSIYTRCVSGMAVGSE